MAAFVPSSTTNSEGIANIPIKLPDSLTKFRVLSVASFENDKFGIGETFLVTQLPIALRPSLTRFLNVGDKNVEMPVVIQNQTDQNIVANIGARLHNCEFSEESPKGFTVSIEAKSRKEVKFRVNAKTAGIARLQFGAELIEPNLDCTDAAEISIPVWTPATTEGLFFNFNFDFNFI